VTTDARLFILVRAGTIATREVLVFLRHLLRHVPGPIVLVWDNLNTHRSMAVHDFLKKHRARLFVEYLPAYAPELNPDEWLWRYLKRVELANFAPLDLPHLKRELRLAVMRVRVRPKLVRSFFHASALSF
jgi:transposase